ncbi:MAG: sulfatase [Bacteroidales bacterium]|nr:sulfatase [Bacteroidales bacterium]
MGKSRIPLYYMLFTIILFMLFSCSRQLPEKPNIVLYLADDLSWWDLGCNGNEVVQTPNVDLLAAEGMSMTHMFTASTMCSPSRSALYTGLSPHRNGCHMNHGRVREGIQSLPHYLKPLGYHVALAGKRHIKPPEAFPFDYIQHHPDSVSAYIQGLNGEPFCLVFASHDPHAPHMEGRITADDVSVPLHWLDTWESRDLLARYMNDIEAMDSEFGELIEVLKDHELYRDAVTIFTSDHGFEHFSKWTCYDAGLRVPCMIRWNGVLEGGSENHAMASFVDFLPTFVEMAGGTVQQDIDGISFFEVITDDLPEHRDLVFGTHTTRGIISGKAYPIRSVQDREFKYIMNLASDSIFQNINTHGRTWDPEDASPTWASWLKLAEEDESVAGRVRHYRQRPAEELYKLAEDPWELNNLAGDPQYATMKEQLKQDLVQWMMEQGDLGMDSELAVPLCKRNN